MTKSLLSTCHQISEIQPITDLFLWSVECDDLTANEVPIMSRNTKSLTLWKCQLPVDFLRAILLQLFGCPSLQMLWLSDINLREVEAELEALLESLIIRTFNNGEDNSI